MDQSVCQAMDIQANDYWRRLGRVSGREEHPSHSDLSFNDTANMESSSGHLSANARAFLVDALIGHTGIGQSAKCDKSKSAKSISQNGNAGKISVELLCRDLWKEFHALGTEMIITKAGRRMFPSLKVRLSGLQEDVHYLVYLDIDPVDDKRYRYVYHSSKWVVGGPCDVPHPDRRFVHPDGPQLGRVWNSQSCIAFEKLKLTNGRKPQNSELIPLHSMHKYQPCIYVQPLTSCDRPFSSGESVRWKNMCQPSTATCFRFPETEFITVTAYQNQRITRLKIASNPFAKGFRDSIKQRKKVDEEGLRGIQSTPLFLPMVSSSNQWNPWNAHNYLSSAAVPTIPCSWVSPRSFTWHQAPTVVITEQTTDQSAAFQ